MRNLRNFIAVKRQKDNKNDPVKGRFFHTPAFRRGRNFLKRARACGWIKQGGTCPKNTWVEVKPADARNYKKRARFACLNAFRK